MALDNLKELNAPTKTPLNWFQKIAISIEIISVVLTIATLYFMRRDSNYIGEMMVVAFWGMILTYLFLPILLFRSIKVGQHVLSHISGLILIVELIGTLLRVMSWPYGREMQIVPALLFPLMIILLILIDLKTKKSIDFYLRIGSRYIVILLLLSLYEFPI